MKAKKSRTVIFRCSVCGHEEPKWLGRCPECGAWNTLEERMVHDTREPLASHASHPPLSSLPLSVIDPHEGNRISTGIAELDRVLGGGMMKRSTILVGGEPGIGKSTLLLQAAATSQCTGRVLYISGEESAGQIRMRADRLGVTSDKIELLCTGHMEEIFPVLDAVKPILIIIDSIQTLYTTELGQVPGTINQIKYCTYELIDWVKNHDAILFLVAHVTKDGLISGPKSIEHMVDTVLYFEQNDTEYRFVRAAKNRFGSIDEIGIFSMTEGGMLAVEDPSRLFLVPRDGPLPAGVAKAAVVEGSRVLLVEIQALMVESKGSISRVFSDRIDTNRVSRLAATIEKHLNLRLSDQDIYINVAGGIRLTDVGADLPIAAALYSARTGIPIPDSSIMAGELTLAGEIRPVRRALVRYKTATSLGFQSYFGPKIEGKETSPEVFTSEMGAYHTIQDLKSLIPELFAQIK
ncbi:MAG: DNA repair protein RadA [Treponemataceae bacterium]|nr:DNA repair protein RadA [Treponemataceae bacterium]